MARILVTGGTGAIDPAVISALAEAGHWVRVLSRSPIGREVAPRASQLLQGDGRAIGGADETAAALRIEELPPDSCR